MASTVAARDESDVSEAVLPELEIREFRAEDSHDVKEFCLNILMQRTRLSNQYVYRSSIWLGIYLSAIAWATRIIEPWVRGEWGRWAFLCCAVSALFLVGVDYFTFFYYERLTTKAHKEDGFLQNPATFVNSKMGKCWVAFYNEGLVGCIVVKRTSTKSANAEITHWYVRARYRDKGLGGDLLQKALQYCTETKCSNLTARTATINTRANKTLKKTGFEKTSTKPDSNVYWRMLRMKKFTWGLDPQSFSPKSEIRQ
ncbi:protein of unknown function [Taphrina deformans PYCC 5710]|uniref:N-acetyltransferase domain-containing protein n=1 Tax=Taphrina deformans (strain PYCC 5710 / ATCC 11124 / CBS 356.35 / IMI 108563 / JCM 9778 / NBRC 8474) TaxID=1097556 RepID=R4X8F5_TAPDE|nr:protein of unknown function [Taphrina deformans PYCC 5710]|eukprot:CCG81873.1 protein of unknown function [Taphrina deformans PYCC 5710]